MISTMCFPICTFVVLSLWFCHMLQGFRCLHGRQVCSLMGVCTLQWASLRWPRTEVRSSLSPKVLDRNERFKKVSHSLLLLICIFSAPSQGLCRGIRRCLLTAPLNLPPLCPHVSPQGDRCILEWAHISRTTPWVATDSRGDNTAPKVHSHCLPRGLTL